MAGLTILSMQPTMEEYKTKNFSELEEKIGIKFKQPNYLVQALAIALI